MILLMFLGSVSPANAQKQRDIYGLDPLLYNGRIYSFRLSPETIGHPFLQSQNYQSGSVVISHEKYEGLLLNYDIYNQELILKYKDMHGADNAIKISKAWLRKFCLDNKEFVLMKSEGGDKKFFQVIGCDSLRVLYYWKKEMSLSKEVGKTNYQFSKALKTMYLSRNNEFYRFRNNKSFVAYFDPDKRDAVKKYLSARRINVKKAADEKILDLITHCNHLEH
jgi:hypothetical protein